MSQDPAVYQLSLRARLRQYLQHLQRKLGWRRPSSVSLCNNADGAVIRPLPDDDQPNAGHDRGR